MSNEAGPAEVFAHSNRALTDAPDSGRRPAMAKRTDTLTPAQQIGLIRSIGAYAAGREVAALAEIAAILAGATLEDLVAARGGAN